MNLTCRILRILLPVLVTFTMLFLPAAGNSISTDIVVPESASAGDIISIDILVTNLAPVALDHCNYIFSVSPLIDLIWIPFLGPVDTALHVHSFSDTLAMPPPYGESCFFSGTLLGKVVENALPGSLIQSFFHIDVVSETDPDGNWCPGCWSDSADASGVTVVSAPDPVPEFPGVIVPVLMVFGMAGVVFLKKHQ